MWNKWCLKKWRVNICIFKVLWWHGEKWERIDNQILSTNFQSSIFTDVELTTQENFLTQSTVYTYIGGILLFLDLLWNVTKIYICSCLKFQQQLNFFTGWIFFHEVKKCLFSLIVRFLPLVTTMVTKVDHSNHRSNDRSNHRGYYDGYYDRY